ncbi:MAG: hypothetical protein R2912_10705 [Eubacteriales bacterium]
MKTPCYAMIDLNTRTSARYEIDEATYRKYIGGKMLGARLLYDLTPPASIRLVRMQSSSSTPARRPVRERPARAVLT